MDGRFNFRRFFFLLQTCQPLIKENLETYEKNLGDSTKRSEIPFFPHQDKTNPFSIGGISCLFKSELVFFYICGPSCNKMPLFCWRLWEARDEVITGKKLAAFNFMAKMLDKVPSRLKEALAFPTSFSLFFFFQQDNIFFWTDTSWKTLRLEVLSWSCEKVWK